MSLLHTRGSKAHLPLNSDYSKLSGGGSDDDKAAVYTAWYVLANISSKCGLTHMQVFHNCT